MAGKSKFISLFALAYASIAVCLHFVECTFGKWIGALLGWFNQFIYCVCREASQLAALLKEMKEGLDTVRRKIQSLTAKVGCTFFASSFTLCIP